MADVKQVIKDLGDTNWSKDNEAQMKAVQLLKGLALSDDPKANEFMKAVDKATTSIAKQVLEEDTTNEVVLQSLVRKQIKKRKEKKNEQDTHATGFVVCKKCGAKNPEGAKVCEKCGAKLMAEQAMEYKTCPECGHKFPCTDKVCPKCGYEFPVSEGTEDFDTQFTLKLSEAADVWMK